MGKVCPFCFRRRKQGENVSRSRKIAGDIKKKKKEYLLEKIVKKLERDYLKKNKIDLFLAKDHSQRTKEYLSKKLLEIFGDGKKISLK